MGVTLLLLLRPSKKLSPPSTVVLVFLRIFLRLFPTLRFDSLQS